MAEAISPAWNGGIYYAAQRRSAVTAEAKESPASLALLYCSQWKTEAAAQAFMRIYAGQLPRKYAGVQRRETDEADAGEQVYTTSEGDVLLSIAGKSVYVGEGFPLALSRTLRDRVAAAQGHGPIQTAGLRGDEPAMLLARRLASFGMVKVVLGRRYTATGL